MERLNLPTYSFTVKSEGGRQYIFDNIRRKYVVLTPEEWVRQNFTRFLVSERSCPPSLIAIEKQFRVNRLSRRADILVYSRKARPVMIIECKAPQVHITQQVLDQLALYNLRFNVSYLVLTNGMVHYCCFLDAVEGRYRFVDDIPDYHLIGN
jgi:hypothetical protein